ncbi:hypothetical protein [Piscinibacter gummiphilus]|uniref:Terminase small subunit n=1 Tax=Piscinibacter gummiphilus TaxID=946333 RepID=A0ABZ0CVD9_9BURK|nr:hypothetical protein [Piscinibacter gummiphilus]WOB06479.1 hypothetical protein RXV79_16275 [Piscinibacter gummiphilus]
MTEKREPNWAQIEADYRAGIKPLRQIGEEHGITHGAINKRAKRDGWARDLKAQIVAKAEAKVSKAAVSREVSTDTKVTEQEVVEANAELQYQIRMEHRSDIKRTRKLFQALLDQLETAVDADGKSLIGKLFAVVHQPVDDPNDQGGEKRAARMAELLEKVLSLPSNIKSAKELTDMLEKLVNMERKAFGIDDDNGGGSEVDKLLAKIAKGG